MGRRNFVRQLARGGLLAVLAATAGILVSRGQVSLRENCTDNFQCRNCNKLKGCTLPEAQFKGDGHGEEGKG